MADGISDLPSPTNVNYVIWPKDCVIHRVHSRKFGATAFNDSDSGNARFSPIHDAFSNIIPTIYGGSAFECAAMEIALRDVPFVAGPKIVRKTTLSHLQYSTISPASDLKLVDLSTVGLRRIGLQRTQLIDTEGTRYPVTRRWAENCYADFPDAQGLQWVSRQDDRAFAIVLFGTRIAPGTLTLQGISRDLLGHKTTYTKLLELAGLMSVDVV
jgi:hypothetical protein